MTLKTKDELKWLFGEKYRVNKQTEDKTAIQFHIESELKACKCPKCGTESSKRHSSYGRQIQDTPIHGKQTQIYATLYKYKCINEDCRCRVFSEPVEFVKKNQVRTTQLNQFILYISGFLGNETASQILNLLGIFVSNDSIQRIYDSLTFKDDPYVEAVGIDDVAIRKGYKYATVIYDLNDHHLIALLDGRSAETLKPWLKTHAHVKLIARDRASAYASAIDEVLPECTQVADRFHLLQNMTEHIKEKFKQVCPESIFTKDGQVLLEKPMMTALPIYVPQETLAVLDYDNTPPCSEEGHVINFDNKRRDLDPPQYKAHAQSRREKQQFIRNLQERFQQIGTKRITKLADEFQITVPTLKKYVMMTEAEIQALDQPKPYKKRKTVMDDYLNIIYKMLRDGIKAEVIYSYVLAQGYQGSLNTLEEYIYLLRKNNFPDCTQVSVFHKKELRYPEGVMHLKRKDVLCCLLKCAPKSEEDALTEDTIKIIKNDFPDAYAIIRIFHQFHAVIMGRNSSALDEFINQYKDSSIQSFCESIKKDITPIKNAISSHISSGFVEGNNNKFKLLKRIVYGRSGLVNLEKKCKLAFL